MPIRRLSLANVLEREYMKRIVCAALLLIVATGLFSAPTINKPTTKGATSFAVIVDAETYKRIGKAVDAYRESIEKDGLPSYLVVDEWRSADAVRDAILSLSRQKPQLEGIALVGDIPIPMIRDAQHMTTSFKLDQEYPWIRSSVPSDRFYDDFHLKFTFIKQDSAHPLFFYYALAPESPQRIVRSIYSGRIKPPGEGSEKYATLERYLFRVAQQKAKTQPLKNALTFTGHGYISESLSAWEGSAIAFREQFPTLFVPGATVQSLNHAMSKDMKEILLSKLQDPGLDLAIFHAHGAEDTQYLLGGSNKNTIDQNVEAVKQFIRGKLLTAKRKNKNVEETLSYYTKAYGIPKEWFDNAFADSVILADSITAAKLDIYLDDVEKISPQPKFVMFDECFNGNFTAPDYIAAKYVFGNGTTVASVANSVNVLQDLWANELIGLLQSGVRVGAWHRMRNCLESHIIGDPTFHYAAGVGADLGKAMAIDERNVGVWREFAKSQDVSIKSLAIVMLHRNLGQAFEKEAVTFYRNDPSFNVRLAALKCLAQDRSQAFEEVLRDAVNDPYEYIRRMAIMWMGEISKEEYLPALARAALTDPSERVQYDARSGMEKIGPKKSYEAVVQQVELLPSNVEKNKIIMSSKRIADLGNERIHGDLIPKCLSDTMKLKSRISNIRTFRLYNYQEVMPTLITLAKNENEKPVIRQTALEAMGWYVFAWNRSEFVKACDELLASNNTPASVRSEAVKTRNRLTEGPNDPITP